MQTADVVIIGGAIVGSSTAHFLSALGFKGRVIVVEKDASYQWCASGRSVAGIRQQFSTEENIRLSQFGVSFYRSIKDTFGPEADIAFRERGYMMMASAEGRSVLERNIALQRELGAMTELLEPDEIARRFPWLSTQGVAAAGWGPSGEGWIDPHSLLQLFRKSAIAGGIAYTAAEVTGLELNGDGRSAVVSLASGEQISAGKVINAAGWHSAKIAAMAGIPLPVHPKKRMVFVVDIRDELPGCGLMIDASGLYFRPEGKYFITGIAPPEDADPDSEDFEVDHSFFEEHVWWRLAERVPAFEALKVVNSWACHYDHNLFDHNAILGPHPDKPAFIFASGFSGHGLQQSSGVGRALAELIAHGRYVSIDLSRFDYARIAANRPVRELNVV